MKIVNRSDRPDAVADIVDIGIIPLQLEWGEPAAERREVPEKNAGSGAPEFFAVGAGKCGPEYARNEDDDVRISGHGIFYVRGPLGGQRRDLDQQSQDLEQKGNNRQEDVPLPGASGRRWSSAAMYFRLTPVRDQLVGRPPKRSGLRGRTGSGHATRQRRAKGRVVLDAAPTTECYGGANRRFVFGPHSFSWRFPTGVRAEVGSTGWISICASGMAKKSASFLEREVREIEGGRG